MIEENTLLKTKRLIIEVAYVWSLQFMIGMMAIYGIDLILLHRCPAQHLYFEECLRRWQIVFFFSAIIHLGVRPTIEKYNPTNTPNT